MIDPVVLLTVVPAALALNLTPGADMMFCLAQGMRGGGRAAVAASAGISTGSMIASGLAGLGLGALVASLPWLFDTIRWVGVAYLVWLAVQTLRRPLGRSEVPAARPSRAFRDGLIINLSNPKVILFILAFVPQFVDPEGPVLAQFLIFGGILSLGGFVVNGAVGLSAGGLGRRLAASPGVERVLRVASATVFAGLAARLALEQRP
ncbi:LysE family translocator [Jannaschia pohangensis]|uniref:Threonine/homoserine/homoserine lactone efflux protein n=1 Tax=Jannaschia pohangensis TaxID=390807 RepID=A0A1I3MFZ7_9RHOB|nr:LysE family translocator [Jannaschia pohangensis]SFI95883.1 Threonine/homoserine/homoserine lactone efflux protein [Jannaschia pohangensis]